MRLIWLIFIVLGIVFAAICAGWLLTRRAGVRSSRKRWVVNTGYLRGLPRHQTLVYRTRVSLTMAFICFPITVIATSAPAGTPVDHYIKHDKSAGHDIVLCLDTSGSMLSYDSKIGGAFREIISHLEDERISLQLWDVYSVTVSPLTDDYEMTIDVLQNMSDMIDTGLTHIGNRSNVAQGLLDYLVPVMDENQEVSSIVGDGPASCVMNFGHSDKQRSCTIPLATDSEVYGGGVYNLSEAVEFAKNQGVTVTTLYPRSDITLSSEALQLRGEIRETSGDFYDVPSSSSTDRMVKQIEAEQREEFNFTGKMLEAGCLGAALGRTLPGVASLLGLLAFGRP